MTPSANTSQTPLEDIESLRRQIDQIESPAAAHGSYVTDNRARTFLANERTFLAWLRTGITMIALGLAGLEILTRRASSLGILIEIIAATLILGGTSMVLIEWHRYRKRGRQIEEGNLRSSVGAATIAASIVAVTGLLSIVMAVGANS